MQILRLIIQVLVYLLLITTQFIFLAGLNIN